MSNKLEAATVGTTPNTFTDEEGEVYEAVVSADVIELWGLTDHDDYVVRFFKADAIKIIALIAEATK